MKKIISYLFAAVLGFGCSEKRSIPHGITNVRFVFGKDTVTVIDYQGLDLSKFRGASEGHVAADDSTTFQVILHPCFADVDFVCDSSSFRAKN